MGGWAKACHILSFTQFHAISRNFSYFSHFWANFNMLGIKMHVLQLRNSMETFSHTFMHSLMQFYAMFTHFWSNFNMLGIKMHVHELRKLMVKFSCTLTHLFNALPFEVKKLSNEKLKYKLKRSEITVK